ncbi:MAG: hypothetical protein NTX47_05445, partial [Candidatus Omnitrophica bacterium]|nr:hypothetical protein [Candidatus Omnitrophota bacterium]
MTTILKRGFGRKWFSRILAGCAMLAVFLLTADAHAVQVKRVQTGEVYFDTDDIAQVSEILSVDQSKALVLLYVSSDVTALNATQNVLFSAQFSSNTELVISRDGATYGATVRYYVVEFTSGAKVSRGISSFASGSYTNAKYTTKDVSLAPSLDDYTKAVAVVQARSALTTSTADEITTIEANIQDNNTLRLSRYATNDALKSVNIVWQIVEFSSDVNVKSGIATIAVNSLTGTGSWTGAVTIAKSFLMYSYKANRSVNGIEGLTEVRGAITSTTGVTFTRGAAVTTTLTDIEVKYYVVELTDLVGASQGTGTNLTFATNDETKSQPLATAVDPKRTLLLIGVSAPNDTTTTTYDDETLLIPQITGPKGICYDSSARNLIWVCNTYAGTVSRYNASTGAKVGTDTTVGTMPVAICYVPTAGSESIWVANYSSNNVTRINPVDGTVAATISTGSIINPIDIAADTTSSPPAVWTANYGGTASTNLVTKILSGTNVGTAYGVNDTFPTAICYDGRGYMWVAGNSSTRIHRYDCTAPATNGRYTVFTNAGFSSIKYAASGFGNRAYPQVWVTNLRNNYVALVNVTTITAPVLVADYATELNPRGIAIVDKAGTVDDAVFVTNFGSNSLIKITASDGSVAVIADTEVNPYGIAYDTTQLKLWVSNSNSNSLMSFNESAASPVIYSLADTVSAIYLYRQNVTTSASMIATCVAVQFCPITIIAPNGGEVWTISASPEITWKYSDSLTIGGSGTAGVHKVKLQITKDGTNWYDIPGATSLDVNNSSAVANEGKFTWSNLPSTITGIANMVGETFKVRIFDTDKEASPANFYDTSNNNFIIKGKLAITQPLDTWKIGETKAIQWHANGNLSGLSPSTINISLSTDGGAGFTDIPSGTPSAGADNSDNSWNWTIPSDLGGGSLIGADNIIKLHLNYNPAPAGSTLIESISAPFTLKGQITSVTLPATTPVNTYLLGGSYDITWQKKGHFAGTGLNEGTVDILYSSNDGASYSSTLTSAQAAGADDTNTSWSWPIASDFPKTPQGSTSKVKVVQTNDSTVYKESVGFQVTPGTITVTAPDGGGTWNIGESKNISWTYTGNYATVNIWLSRNNGGDWMPIASPNANSSPYPWIVTGPTSSSCLIKIVSGTYSDVSDVSNATFTIAGSITVSSPNGATDYWNIGQNCSVSWSTVGTFSNVKILLSTDNGVTYPTQLAEVAGNSSPYTGWVIQGPPSDQAKIKVVSSDYSGISDVSDAAFHIFASITLTTPNGGNTWLVGENCNVAWSTVGITGNVKIKLSRNNGGAWTELAEVAGNSSPYDFNSLPT